MDLSAAPDGSSRVDSVGPADPGSASSEDRFWSAYMRLGFVVLAATSVAVVTFLRVSPELPDRGVLTVVAGAVSTLAAVMVFEVQRIAARPWRSTFSLAMHLASGAGLAVFCYFAGGVDTALTFLLVLPIFSAALALSPAAVSFCGVAGIAEAAFLALTDTNVTSERDSLVALFALVLSSAALATAFAFTRHRLQEAEIRDRRALLRSSRTDA